ncbi:MAG: DNA polymerase III subunit delta [Prevotella sp.]|nr:DNA polymerase III subunit delta [Prevotella sp.]
MKFQEVIGQGEAKQRLVKLVEEGRVPHAMLFTGPKGCGKMAMAMAFASYLLCANRHDGDSCGTCPQCIMLRKWVHPDLHFTYPVIKQSGTTSDYKPVSDDFSKEWHDLLADGPYFTIEQWLQAMGTTTQQAIMTVKEADAISHKLSLRSSQGGYKVSLIWLPERMREDTANKLLKMIEEPPSQTVFILVSENPAALLETIRSRTQLFSMHRIAIEDIELALVQKRGIDEEPAKKLARFAEGSWLKALDALDAESENREFLTDFISLNRLSFSRDVKGLAKWSQDVTKYGREKQKRMLAFFLRMTRESFMYNFHIPQLTYLTTQEENFVKKFAPFMNENNVMEMAEVFSEAIRDIGQNANARIVFFDVALQSTKLIRNK